MRVFACVTQDHNLWLLAVASIICVLGSWVAVRLITRSGEGEARMRLGWVFLGSVAAGSTVWCTHFVAMLAYEPGVPISYTPGLTGLSLLVAIVGSGIAIALSGARFPLAPETAGVVFGISVTAMHYTGMAAFTADAIVQWDVGYVVASVVFAVGFGTAAFSCCGRGKVSWHGIAAASLLVLAIICLHFTAMGAIVLVPLAPPDGALTDEAARGTLAVAISGVAFVVLGTGIASFLMDSRTRFLGIAQLRHLVESAVDGMVVEQDGHIITANIAFARLVGARRKDILGRRFLSYVDEPDAITEGSIARTSLSQPDGIPVPVEVSARRDDLHSDKPGAMVYSVRDLRPRLEHERRIAQLSYNDSLTGLPNRASFLERLDSKLRTAAGDQMVAMITIDLDQFKEVNDVHGLAVGDRALQILSTRMRSALYDGEFLARLGGDEFGAVAEVAGHTGALDLARRLDAELGAEIDIDGVAIKCGGSIGISVYPDDATTLTTLMNNADLAKYRAQESISTNICFYDVAMDDAVRERRRIMTDLREALTRNQFELRYQVQTAIATGDVIGYEVLLRWRHPERGFIPPSDFIPIAEETGLILPIGEWVLRTACEEAVTWDTPHKIAVNLSAVQLSMNDLPRLVHQILIDTSLPASRLELEVTETAVIRDPERTIHVLRQIKALGVSISMDDFGVGYSSFSTLRAFPYDKIKLDKSFMDEFDTPQARAVIRAILTLGKSLGIAVIAEGVETEEQLDFLREEGCDEAQGYLLGRPEVAPAVTESDVALERAAL